MPFKITVMGIEEGKVTFGISATFRGQEIPFDRTTYVLVPGDELNLIIHAKFNSGKVTEEGELEISPDGLYLPPAESLYKVEPN